MNIAPAHFSAFLRSNLEQALAVPLCLVFGFIAASQGQWWSIFIFAFAAVYGGLLLRAWKKSMREATPSRAALISRHDVQRLLQDSELLSMARELPIEQGVHAGIVRHGLNDVSFVKLDTSSLTVSADWGATMGSETPTNRNFSTLDEALSWCRRHDVAWLSGTRAETRVLHQLFPESV